MGTPKRRLRSIFELACPKCGSEAAMFEAICTVYHDKNGEREDTKPDDWFGKPLTPSPESLKDDDEAVCRSCGHVGSNREFCEAFPLYGK